MSVIEDILLVSRGSVDNANYTIVDIDDSNGSKNSKFTVDEIDSILLNLLTENETVINPLQYLNSCFQRCRQFKRINKNNSNADAVVQEVDRLVIGYGLVILQIEGFAINGNMQVYFKDLFSNLSNYADFLSQICKRSIVESSEFELVNYFFLGLHSYIMDDLVKFDLNNNKNYDTVLSLFELFLSYKPIAAIFTKIDNFVNNCYALSANEFEKKTLLGPILSLSPLNIDVALSNYGNDAMLEKNQQQINMIHTSLQAEHKVVLERLFYIIDKIIRGSVDSRNNLLSYFGAIVNKNHLRRGDHANSSKLASNAFMSNITIILVKFSQPFLDVTFNKIDKIDVNYFNNLNLFIDLTNETRVNSDYKEADEFYDQSRKENGTEGADCKPNFISDCFFLTLTYLHYGIGGTLLYDEKVTPQIKRLKEEVERVKKLMQTQPMFANFANLQLKEMEKNLNIIQSLKLSLKGFFSHKEIQTEIFDFICGASTFFVRVIDPIHHFPFDMIKLPLIPDQVGVENVDNADYLRAHAPIPFKYYPEFVIEGPINYALYIAHYNSSPLFRNSRLQSFLEFATLILRCPEIVSNPHLKGKLVQLLSVGAMPLMDDSAGFMMEIFEHNELVSSHLLYALLDFYVIVEKTGSSSQFYDKFNSRYSISIILQEIYSRIPKFKEQIIYLSKDNADFFVRFVARMLNDLTFLLDEGLTNLAEVHNIQNEIDNRAKGLPQVREEDDAELEKKLASAERQAKSSCGLATKSMSLFELYSKDIPNAFVTPEVVGRLASMLDYNLESLVGPKCGELKVKDPQKYSFDPKTLLRALTTVYVNLSDEPDFIDAVAKDGRSFSKELFNRAVHILGRKTGLVTESFCSKLIKFANNAEAQRIADEEEDQEYGDVPEEFLDPLMYSIMKDPVTLPTSKVNIDRSTIKAHLLSDSTDPFNRTPLKLEEVIPNDELKQRIIQFKQDKKASKETAK